MSLRNLTVLIQFYSFVKFRIKVLVEGQTGGVVENYCLRAAGVNIAVLTTELSNGINFTCVLH